MYSFLYDKWNKRFPLFQDSIDKLYEKSTREIVNEDDIESLSLLFGYLEYYLASIMKLGYVDKSNVSCVLEQLKGIVLIKIMDSELRKKFNGLTYQNVILVNPEPEEYPDLDCISSLQLAFYHELGHIITSLHQDELSKLMKKYSLPNSSLEDLKNGFDLLEEVAVQNVAESLVYDRLGLSRPDVSSYKSPILYPEGEVLSNFSIYREFQELAFEFSMMLSFLQEDDSSMNGVLDRLSKAMFSKDFVAKINKEFSLPEKRDDLLLMLCCMGKIKNAKFSSFGYGNVSKEDFDVSKYFEMIHTIFEKYSSSEKEEVKEKIQS